MLNDEKVKISFFILIVNTFACAVDIRQEAISWSHQQRIENENKYNIRAILFQKNIIKFVELTESWNGHRTCYWRSAGYGDWPDGTAITMKNECTNKHTIGKIFSFINKSKNRLAPNSDVILDDNGLIFSVQSRTSEFWVRASASDFSMLYSLLEGATN